MNDFKSACKNLKVKVSAVISFAERQALEIEPQPAKALTEKAFIRLTLKSAINSIGTEIDSAIV